MERAREGAELCRRMTGDKPPVVDGDVRADQPRICARSGPQLLLDGTRAAGHHVRHHRAVLGDVQGRAARACLACAASGLDVACAQRIGLAFT